MKALFSAFSSSEDAKAGADLLGPSLLPLYHKLDPDSVGGAVLLGVNGIAIVSHGSSSANAILNAIKQHELYRDNHVANLQSVLKP